MWTGSGDGSGATDAGRNGRANRCAIYTRKSSEEGLGQDFNSLHAQREACEAYVLSQRHEGWAALPTFYDDGGFSGGTMERPGLRQLMADIEVGLIDCVVVYKVDRLTRSLSDFARIVDRFDACKVSFVSVTQAFNTTSSMGRLTLNVLLSFAQFEREVTGERIRDKIAASKRKGLWMGGWVPLGYSASGRTLTIAEAEADTVRTIYRLYLDLGNVRLVEEELDRRRLRTKSYVTASGRRSGGEPFSRGHLYRILSNPLYRGRIVHKGVIHRGQHPPIIDRETWEAVEAQLKTNGPGRRVGRNVRDPSLLAGLLVDGEGNRFAATHASKNGRRYRYYASGGAGVPVPIGKSDSTRAPRKSATFRLGAGEIEPLILAELTSFLRDEPRLADWLGQGAAVPDIAALRVSAGRLADDLDGPPVRRRQVLCQVVRKIQVEQRAIWITLRKPAEIDRASDSPVPDRWIGSGALERLENAVLDPSGLDIHAVNASADAVSTEDHGQELAPVSDTPDLILHLPVQLTRRGVETRLVLATGTAARSPEPDRSLVKAIARAQAWWAELSTGQVPSLKAIAEREGVTDRYVGQIIELAFLSPRIVDSVLSGEQPAALTAKGLTLQTDVPLVWERQLTALAGHGA